MRMTERYTIAWQSLVRTVIGHILGLPWVLAVPGRSCEWFKKTRHQSLHMPLRALSRHFQVQQTCPPLRHIAKKKPDAGKTGYVYDSNVCSR
jgi:hypothetical protein